MNVYESVHLWLKQNYGKASKCENTTCEKISEKFEWSKLDGKEYQFVRDNFWMLCVKCHRKYDAKPKFKKTEREIAQTIKDIRLHLALELHEFCKLLDVAMDDLLAFERNEAIPSIKIFRSVYKIYLDNKVPFYDYNFRRYIRFIDSKLNTTEDFLN